MVTVPNAQDQPGAAIDLQLVHAEPAPRLDQMVIGFFFDGQDTTRNPTPATFTTLMTNPGYLSAHQ